MSLKASFWRIRYARWAARPTPNGIPGYTLLLPVPGDLPVFTELALDVCRTQEASQRLETVVLPDIITPTIRSLVASASTTWPGRITCRSLPAVDRLLLPRLGDPGRNHGSQLIRGVSGASSTHIILHDADLFLLDEHIHEDEYAITAREGLEVLGVSPAWDAWYEAHGRTLAATWEMCAPCDWFRKFPPSRHIGHDAQVLNELHTFDTTFWPQWHTRPEQIAVGEGFDGRIVHFNYVISTYRAFQRTPGIFHDEHFRLLLIRLFIELFGQAEHDYGLPTITEMVAGIDVPDSSSTRVRYSTHHRDAYVGMRAKLDAILDGAWSDPERVERGQHLLGRFDSAFGVPSTA